MFKSLAIASVIALTASVASAADVYSEGNILYIIGETEHDDAEYIIDELDYNRNITEVHVSGPGGALGGIQGFDISDMKTVAIDECWSACALLWAKGKTQEIRDNSYVGFHVGSGDLEAYQEDFAGEEKATQVDTVHVVKELLKAGWTMEFIETYYAWTTTDIFFAFTSMEEANRFKGDVFKKSGYTQAQLQTFLVE